VSLKEEQITPPSYYRNDQERKMNLRKMIPAAVTAHVIVVHVIDHPQYQVTWNLRKRNLPRADLVYRNHRLSKVGVLVPQAYVIIFVQG